MNDEQGYFNLQNSEVFQKFWEDYQTGIDCSFVCYTITQTGNLDRVDFTMKDGIGTILYNFLCIDNDAITLGEPYQREIKDLSYDSYGYFSYMLVLTDEEALYTGGKRYGYLKIDSVDENLLMYQQKYIEPFEYDCNNFLTIDWDSNSLDKINFNDLIEYIYQLKHDAPFYTEDLESASIPLTKKISASFFENLIKEYFQVETKTLRKDCLFDEATQTYPFYEAYCIASHWEVPKLIPKVVDAKKDGNILTLTIHAIGYEMGYPLGYTHELSILENDDGSFQYLKNEIMDSPDNQIPEHENERSITCEGMLRYND
ncbi:MAG: DUF6070 family protein [Coprobacillaceae bacterium]